MRIVPSSSHANSQSRVSSQDLGAPSAPGLHDTLRHGVGPVATPSTTQIKTIDSAHPLETRLAHWQATQESMKMEGLRRTFGLAEPIRRGMELKMVRDGEWRFSGLGGSERSISEEILMGSDTKLDWEDIYTGKETRTEAKFGEELERKVGMGL